MSHATSDRLGTALRTLVFAAAAAISLALPATAPAGQAGALYTETNQPSNEVVVLGRDADGSIGVIQRIGTGGAGTLNNPPFGQNHLDVDNEVELTDDGRLLFAVNAGDNTVSSFRVGQHGRLTLADVESTAGDHPVSLDTHNGLLYVLNGLDAGGNDLLGLRYSRDGVMTPIPGSIRRLATPFSADNGFGFASPLADHVLFSPDGRELTVTERTSNAFAGQLDAFAVRGDGTLGPVQANASSDAIPFGMAWDNHGHLIVPNAGPPPSFHGSGSSYSLSGTTLTPIDTEPAGGNATCWVVVTSNGKYAFMSNQMTEDVSRFAIGNGGTLVRLGNVPLSGPGADTALSTSSRFLYVLDVLNANGAGGALIDAYRVGADGSLVHLGTTDPAIPDSAGGLAAR
jgi:6-phosphogluconolactonase